jgi:hypothetical protein
VESAAPTRSRADAARTASLLAAPEHAGSRRATGRCSRAADTVGTKVPPSKEAIAAVGPAQAVGLDGVGILLVASCFAGVRASAPEPIVTPSPPTLVDLELIRRNAPPKALTGASWVLTCVRVAVAAPRSLGCSEI